MKLIDAVALYGKLCMTNGADGIAKRIPDYDVDNKPITIKIRDVHSAIISAKTVDAVEVVRCKDCKHAWIHPSGYIHCRRSGLVDHDLTFSPVDFCSYGERRSDNAAD